MKKKARNYQGTVNNLEIELDDKLDRIRRLEERLDRSRDRSRDRSPVKHARRSIRERAPSRSREKSPVKHARRSIRERAPSRSHEKSPAKPSREQPPFYSPAQYNPFAPHFAYPDMYAAYNNPANNMRPQMPQSFYPQLPPFIMQSLAEPAYADTDN